MFYWEALYVDLMLWIAALTLLVNTLSLVGMVIVAIKAPIWVAKKMEQMKEEEESNKIETIWLSDNSHFPLDNNSELFTGNGMLFLRNSSHTGIYFCYNNYYINVNGHKLGELELYANRILPLIDTHNNKRQIKIEIVRPL